MSAPTRLFCHIFRRVPSSLDEQTRKNKMKRSPQTPPTSKDPAVNTSRIDSCWICGDSAIEERERIALAVQQRHDDGSSFGRQWTNHHGLMRCDCDELVEFIRGLDKK